MRAALGEHDAVPGLVVCVQTFGSVAHFHPHLHVLMSDGAFRRDAAAGVVAVARGGAGRSARG